MSPYPQHNFSERNKRLVIAGSVVVGILWTLLACYALFGNKESQGAITSGPVVVHAPSPTGGGAPVATYTPPRSKIALPHPDYVSRTTASSLSSTPAFSGASMRIHETSSATIHTIGGGGNGSGIGGGANGNSGTSSSARGIHSTALAYTGAIYVPTPHTALTVVGAKEAGEVVQEKMGITLRRQTDDGTLPGYNDDPVEDEDEDTPIGDVTWGLMLLLTIGWCVRVHRKRQQACR